MEIFKEYKIASGSLTHIRTGYTDIWIKKNESEWFIYHEQSSVKLKPKIETVKRKEDWTWIRVISEIKSDTLFLAPKVPDKPVIVQSPEEIIIPEKQSAKFYIEIPLFIMLKQKSKNELLLMEIPSEILSKTWFGDISGGILSYSLNTVLSSKVIDNFSPSSSQCSIIITNKSKSPFRFRKLSVYAQNFSIFEGKEKDLWCNNSFIDKYDNDELKISIDSKAPEGKRLLYENEKYLQDKNILKKGFTVIMKSVSGE